MHGVAIWVSNHKSIRGFGLISLAWVPAPACPHRGSGRGCACPGRGCACPGVVVVILAHACGCGVWWGASGTGQGAMGGPYNCPVGWARWTLVGSTAVKTYLEKDLKSNTDINRTLLPFYLWLVSFS